MGNNEAKARALGNLSYRNNAMMLKKEQEKVSNYDKADENWGKQEEQKDEPNFIDGISKDWNDGTITGKAKAVGKGALGVVGTALALPVVGAYYGMKGIMEGGASSLSADDTDNNGERKMFDRNAGKYRK